MIRCSEKVNPQDLYNILLLVLLVMTYAIDTSICERGFATMNLLKTKKRCTRTPDAKTAGLQLRRA